MSAISDKHDQLGGPTGLLGVAVGAELDAAGGGRKQEFQRGSIYWHPRTGAFEVHGQIRERWLALGAESSFFGYPSTDEKPTPDGTGRFNDFEHASIYWHPEAGAWEVHGLIRDRWRALGGSSSALGYPLTNETKTPDSIGRYNHFQHGSIYWQPATGAFEVFGPIRARWAELGWERSTLGYPIAPPLAETRNREAYLVAEFENGRIELNRVTQRVIARKDSTAASPNYQVPVVAYRISDDDGTRACAVTSNEVQLWVDEANRVYASAGVEFRYDGILLDLRDTQVNNVTGEDYPAWTAVRDKLNALAARHRAVVVAHRAELGGGFSWTTYDFVAMSFFDAVHLNALSILAHELGHHFGLPHTHARTFATLRDAEDFALGGGSLADLDGDASIISDTPPDPHTVELGNKVEIEAVTLAGQSVPLARRNIMSYWNHGGRGQITAGQIDRVRQLVVERKNRYLNVAVVSPINCPAVLAKLASLKERLAELIVDRDAEPDPAAKRRYFAAIANVRRELASVSGVARTAGCI